MPCIELSIIVTIKSIHMKTLQFILSIFLNYQVFSQVPVTMGIKIDSVIQHYHSGSTTPGVSVSVYYENDDVFDDFCRGISHDTVTIKPNMNFSIGSNSKMFTSIVLLKLEENGLCSLNDSIGTYLINLPPTISGQITIKQLLQHKSGLDDYIDASGLAAMNSDFSQDWDPQDIIDQFVGAPSSAPGGQFQYCNTNYLLAGMVIEAITGTTFLQAMNNHVFDPNSMNNLFLMGKEPIIGDLAHAWDNGEVTGITGDITGLPMNATGSFSWSAGGLWSTPRALAEAFKKIHVDQSVLNASSYSSLISGVNTGYGAPMNSYGLGLFNTSTTWVSAILHTGSWYHLSAMLLDKTNNNVVVVAINNTEGYSNSVDVLTLAINVAEEMRIHQIASSEELSSDELNWIKSISNKKITLNQEASYCEVYSLSGQKVAENKYCNSIDLSFVESGIYILNVEGQSFQVYLK